MGQTPNTCASVWEYLDLAFWFRPKFTLRLPSQGPGENTIGNNPELGCGEHPK